METFIYSSIPVVFQDIDDFFQKERDKSLKYNTDVKRVNQVHNILI